MVGRRYVPDAGDFVWLTFDPQAGHEQVGRRPALIVSPRAYNAKARLALACPITSHRKGYPFEVAIPAGQGIAGAVLDVFRTEPLPAEHPFWQTPGITVLPHIGGGHPTRDRMVAELFTANAKRYLAGEPLLETVDRVRGY